MEPSIIFYNKEDYLETGSGNKINKKTLIRGSDQIQPNGKAILMERCIIRGDLARISFGKYTILHQNVTLRPSYKRSKGATKFIPIILGEYVLIEANSIVSASKIGSYVHIGKNCIIGARCVINDNVKILDESIIPPDTIVPPFSVYGGKPGIYKEELPETVTHIYKEMTINFYNNFIVKLKENPSLDPIQKK